MLIADTYVGHKSCSSGSSRLARETRSNFGKCADDLRDPRVFPFLSWCYLNEVVSFENADYYYTCTLKIFMDTDVETYITDKFLLL